MTLPCHVVANLTKGKGHIIITLDQSSYVTVSTSVIAKTTTGSCTRPAHRVHTVNPMGYIYITCSYDELQVEFSMKAWEGHYVPTALVYICCLPLQGRD